ERHRGARSEQQVPRVVQAARGAAAGFPHYERWGARGDWVESPPASRPGCSHVQEGHGGAATAAESELQPRKRHAALVEGALYLAR
ncbi:unnamed protein product, partial [Closterium sp. NIES-54]